MVEQGFFFSIVQKLFVFLCKNENVIYCSTEKNLSAPGNLKHFTDVFSPVLIISPRQVDRKCYIHSIDEGAKPREMNEHAQGHIIRQWQRRDEAQVF